MKAKKRVLFLCTGNSARSQMAEGFLADMAGDEFEVFSAGTEPRDEIHPLAIRAMDEAGIDISKQEPEGLRKYLGIEFVSYLIIVCDKAKNTCPRIWPGLEDDNRIYWPFDDPAETEGSEEEQMETFRRVRDEIKEKIEEWLMTL
jgi:arsenate reductase